MDIDLLDFILKKAYKIYLYDRQPRTDEQFFKRQNYLREKYKEARKNYLLTSDPKYKTLMSHLKEFLSLNVSQTEYELCKKILADYKASYSDVIDEKFWNYFDLIDIVSYINAGRAKSIEEAVQILKAPRDF